MALIKCPECGKEVSDRADKCINCGYPIHKPKTIAMDTVKERVGEAVKAGEAINDKILAVSNLDKIMLWSAVSLLLIIMFVVAITFHSKPIIGNAKIGMTKDEVLESKSVAYTDEDTGACAIEINEFGKDGLAWYEFDEDDKLESIMFMADSNSYMTFSDIFSSILEKYGYPDVCKGQFSSKRDNIQRFYWNVGNNTVQLLYVGMRTAFQDKPNFSVNVTRQENIDRDEEITINFHKNKNCSANGCHRKAEILGSYCDYHGCEIIGCENPADEYVRGMNVCQQHEDLLYNNVIAGY